MTLNRRSFLFGAAALIVSDGIARADAVSAPAPIRAQVNISAREPRYWMGAAYYPEQYPPDRWDADFGKMAELGINVVRVGEFAWSAIEPSAGRFEFDWLDRVIVLARKHGIAVILGTPTASVPPWLRRMHPGVLGANAFGAYTYGGRKGIAMEDPVMREAARRVITAEARRYGNCADVIGWQLSNEPGYPMENYDHSSLLGFRAWLQRRYGTIAKLNATWSGKFWSNEYRDWNEIEFATNSAEGGANPGYSLDYRRYFSSVVLDWLRFESDLVRQYSRGQFLYINWPNTRWSVDVRQAEPLVDAAGWDDYGPMPGSHDQSEVLASGLDHDLLRCARRDQRFWVSEQPSQPAVSVPDTAVRLNTYMDMAHGSLGTIFFEWCPPVIGSERGYVSILEPDGSYGRTADQFRKMKSEMAKLGPVLAEAKTEADVALLYSYTNQWAQGSSWRERPNVTLPYDELCQRYYLCARALLRNVDVVPEEADLEKYRLLFAPGLRLVSNHTAQRLVNFIRGGGVLVIDHRAGLYDEDGRLRPSLVPGPFREVAGLVAESSLDDAPPQGCTLRFTGGKESFSVDQSLSRLRPEGASILATFTGDGVDNLPAVMAHGLERGHAVTIAAELSSPQFYKSLAAVLARRFGLQPILELPPGATVLSRKVGRREYLFVLNMNRKAIEVNVPFSCREMIGDKTIVGSVKIPPIDLILLEREATMQQT